MPKQIVYHTITDDDVEAALARVRSKTASASDAALLEEYIAGLKAIVVTFRAGEDDLALSEPNAEEGNDREIASLRRDILQRGGYGRGHTFGGGCGP